MGQIKQLSKDTLIYGFGHFLKRSIGFWLIPVYTRFLSPADYGYLELLNIMLSVSLVIFSQGLGTSFFRAYADLKDSVGAALGRLVSTSYNYLIMVSAVTCIVLFVLAEKLSWLLFDTNGEFVLLLRLVIVTVFFQSITLIPFQYFRANLESVRYVTISLIQFVIQLVFSLYFVIILKMAIKGILLAGVISAVFAAGLTLYMIRQNLRFTIAKQTLKELLVYGMPLIPAALAFWILNMSDRFMLQKLATTHELGLYSLGTRFSSILTFLLVTPFQTAWGPLLFQIAAQKDGQQTFRRITTYFLLAACSIGTMIIVFIPLAIQYIAGPEFWNAYKVVPLLVYANIAGGMFIVLQVGIYYFKMTKYAAYTTMAGAALNIALNFLLIPRFGMMGAAVTSLISYLAILFLVNLISQRLYAIQYEAGRMLKIACVFAAVTLFSSVFHFDHRVLDAVFRIGLVVVFCTSFYFMNFFDHEERLLLRRLLAELHGKKGLYEKFNFGISLIKN